MQNPNCDNDKCISSKGQVRVLPIGGGGNAILCRACFNHEMNYRIERNLELDIDAAFDLPSWESLEVYDGC